MQEEANVIKELLLTLEDISTDIQYARDLSNDIHTDNIVSADNDFDEYIVFAQRHIDEAFRLLDQDATPTMEDME